MALTRRQLLAGAAASGAMLVARPWNALARPLTEGVSRVSKLAPGLRVVNADLHNHTLLSDGDGDPAAAFESMRRNGIDVAAITDHAGTNKHNPLGCDACGEFDGIDEAAWQRIGELADAANDDGSFVAVRGFEWSSPSLGHMNVWFSQRWTDPLATAGAGPAHLPSFLMHEGDDAMPSRATFESGLRALPGDALSMAPFYAWLATEPSTPVIGGGLDAIAGFNHPGREGGRFGYFAYDGAIADRVVSFEAFNRGEDYLFEGAPYTVSPIVECLDAGWRVGFTGVTDEHGQRWGEPEGKGRTGLWLPDGVLTRDAVRASMQSRRFYSSREVGLRLDATANGVPMGGLLSHASGDVGFAIDLDRGPALAGSTVLVQVLQTGNPLPTIVDTRTVTVPAADAPPIELTVPIDRANGSWVVLRITDPSMPADGRATGDWALAGRALAYASPFFLVD